jgi:hypothetical protein
MSVLGVRLFTFQGAHTAIARDMSTRSRGLTGSQSAVSPVEADAQLGRESLLLPADDAEGLLQTETRDRPQVCGVDEVIRDLAVLDLAHLVLESHLPQQPERLLERLPGLSPIAFAARSRSSVPFSARPAATALRPGDIRDDR